MVRTEWALLGSDGTVLLRAGSGGALRPVDATLAVFACWSQVARERLTEHCSKVQGDDVPWQSGLDPDQDSSHAVLCALISLTFGGISIAVCAVIVLRR